MEECALFTKTNVDEIDIAGMRRKFNDSIFAVLASKRPDNNAFLTRNDYNEKINEVMRAHAVLQTAGSKKSARDYRLVRKYDYVKLNNGRHKLVKPVCFSNEKLLCYVTNDELFDILHKTHLELFHGGRNRMKKALNEKYCNITAEAIMAYLRLCICCQRKSSCPHRTAEQDCTDGPILHSVFSTANVREGASGLGRPKLLEEFEPPEIVRVVLEIARFGGFVDSRKCQELIKRCRSSEDVDKELLKSGLRLQKCTNYLRVLPVGFSPEQGLRYETTVPVRLAHSQTGKDHVAHKFCAATINSLECLASILGSRQVAIVSQDCRARVPLAISAAGKQAPILMRMEYQECPEQEFIAPSRHKLYLNVLAGITVQDELMGVPEAVGFSGPTYISIRPGKQTYCLAASNALDLERLLWLPAFQDMMRVDGNLKPVLMLTVYGGPDESPRYSKTLHQAVHIFRKYDLDAFYMTVTVPGKSIGNKVERRLAPLSRELFGVVLPHDPYGSHLNDLGTIVDDEMETRNFELAADVLCETWGRFVIDGHPVVVEYVGHKGEDMSFENSIWYSNHVRESQYCLQIVKCGDISCCTPLRSNLKNVLPTGFFPGPYPLKRTAAGLVMPSPAEITGEDDFPPFTVRQMVNLRPANPGNALPPYDQYCLSVRAQILGRTCHLCGLYFASKKTAHLHAQGVHKTSGVPPLKVRPRMILAHRKKEILCLLEDPTTGAQDADWLDEEDVDLVGLSIPGPPQSTVIPIIGDKLSDWVQFPWLPDV